MKLSVGYKLPDGRDSFPEIVSDYRDAIAEVYFALPGESSGRLPLGLEEGWNPSSAGDALLSELKEISALGPSCVVLFNAACYGAEARSADFVDRVRRKVESLLKGGINLTAATTTSPFIAEWLKRGFPELELRASVNMRVGSVEAMECLSGAFDAFYMQRDYNRDIGHAGKLKAWCDAHGKRLLLLANSGCLRHCPFQSFHDNLVAHEDAPRADAPANGFPAPCWSHLADGRNRWQVLRNTWIRPEDIHHYEKLFPMVKLATRMHDNPRKAIAAYAAQSYKGDLLDLMEPGHSPLFGDSIIDNKLFPSDWFEKTSQCSHNCDSCGYCKTTFRTVCRRVPQTGIYSHIYDGDEK